MYRTERVFSRPYLGTLTMRSPRIVAAVAVALLFLLSGVATALYAGNAGRPADPASAGASPPNDVALTVPAAASGPAAAPDGLNSSLRNLMFGQPCNDQPDRQVSQVLDPTTGYLYEAFIGCGGIGFARSVNGGYSFQPAYQLPDTTPHLITNPDGDANDTCVSSMPFGGSGHPPPRPITCDDNASAWDPDVAVSPNGTVYVSYLEGYLDGYLPGGAPAITWSYNHGASFQGYANISTWVNGTYNDRPSLAVAPNGTVYVAWDYAPTDAVHCPPNYPENCTDDNTASGAVAPDYLNCAVTNGCAFTRGQYQIVISSSTNGGRNWSAPVNVTPLTANIQTVTAELAVSSSGTIDALLQQYPSNGSAYILGMGVETFTQSTDGGLLWTTPHILSPLNFSNQSWWVDGSLEIDRSGTLWVGFNTYISNLNESTAYAMASTDGGFSWSAPVALSHGGGSGTFLEVTVAGNGSGSGFAAWMANNTTNHYWAAYGANLYDNGTVEGPILLLSDGTGETSRSIGNTIGVTSLGGTAYAVGFTLPVYQPTFGLTQSEVFLAVPGLALPPGPVSLHIAPGAGEALLSWSEPATNATITGYLILWYLEATNVGNLTVGPTATAAIAGPLLPYVRYELTVSAVNGAGAGPAGPPVYITLISWTLFRGSLSPASGSLTFDDVLVPLSDGSYSVNASDAGHSLTASATNFSSDTLVLTGVWNATVWQNFTLSLLGSVVRGTVFPVSGSISWDAQPIEVTGGAFQVDAAGDTNHTLSASFPGFASVSVAVYVPANTTVWENLTLQPLPGTLWVTVVPASAQVWVNGDPVNLTANGSATVTLSAGSYSVRATATGYQPWLATVSVLPGQVTNLTIPLVASPPDQNPNGSGAPPTPFYVSPYFLGGLAVLLVALLLVYLLAVRARRREDRRPKPRIPIDESELERVRQLDQRTPDEHEPDPPS
jgi:hypothetical protein